MSGHNIAYRRVSAIDQNTSRQLEEMDVEFHEVFEDKASAKDTARPQLQACMKYLRKGDTLHVHSIDRLARNLADLQRLVDELTGRGVTVKFHKEGLTFTGGDNAMAKLMLQMMGAFAEFERSLIRERQREGIVAAQGKGKHLGRPAKLSLAETQAIRERVARGAEKKALAMEFRISRQTLYKLIKD